MNSKQKNMFLNVLTLIIVLSPFLTIKSSCDNDYYRKNIDDGCPFPYDITNAASVFSFSLKEIFYKGVFNYPNVDISANYTIQSHNDTEQTIGIFFPFSMDGNITIHSIMTGNQSLEFNWRINITIDAYHPKFSENLKLLQLELTFAAFEEKTIYLNYSFPYHTYTIQTIFREHRYLHFFEPAKLWENPHQSVHYEIWIPKSYLKNNGVLEYGIWSPRGWKEIEVEENEDFSIIIFENENNQVEAKYIEPGYQDTIGVSPEIGLIILTLEFLIVFSLLAVAIIIFYRKLNNLLSVENLKT
ncbi:MAG: hypothetical protein ACFFB2_15895 [Promethearchaeota archaeon]